MTSPLSDNLVLLVGGIVIYKVIDLLVTSAYKKLTGDKYVTRGYCASCQKGEAELAAEIKVIRGVLLVVAVQLGVPEAEWKKLVK